MSTSLLILIVALTVLWIWDELRSAPTIEDDEAIARTRKKDKR